MIQEKINTVPLEPSYPFKTEANSMLNDSSYLELNDSSSIDSKSINNSSGQYYFTNNESKNSHLPQKKLDKASVSKRNFFTEKEDHLLTMAAMKYKKERWSGI